jgi:colanic acid biosynthesis glycosyl transferase WcaI
MIQEASFMVAQSLAIPALRTPDVVVAVSPSFPALLPAMLNARLRQVPWVLWLKDILPDGAGSTGLLSPESRAYRAAVKLERLAYRSAAHIFVLSETFRRNLLAKRVPGEKVTRIYDPATRPLGRPERAANSSGRPRVLCMGNIGHSQGLPAIVDAFQEDPQLERCGAVLVLTGTGVEADEVEARIRTDRVEMLGTIPGEDLERELSAASVAVVTQSYTGGEFNVPSKVMNYFAAGLPVVASVHPDGEVNHLLELSGAGWSTDSADPATFAQKLAEVLTAPDQLRERGEAALQFAAETLTPERIAEQFEETLERVA